MSRRRRPARVDRAPGAGPDRPEARPGGAEGGVVGSRGGNGPETRSGGAGRLRPLLVWLVLVGLLAAAVLGLRLGAGDVELLVRAHVSEVGRDLLVRLKMDTTESSQDQALATKEFSEYDLMHMNFFLDVSALSISKAFTYKGGFNLGTQYFKHANEEERTRRARLYLEATKSMNDYANQARNAVK